MRRHLLQAGAAFAILATAPLTARHARADDDDHEKARVAMEAGRIRPLAQILAEVERRFVGQVVETELDDEDDGRRWTYKLKLLPPSGRLYRVELDAASGAVLRTRGPVQERR